MHYLISTAGHPNVGDELITRTWLREIARRSPDEDVWLDCPNPSGAQALFAADHPRLRCVDTVFRLCWEAPGESPWELISFVSAALAQHGHAPRWIPGLRVFGAASTVHLLGGGYVNDMWPRHLGLLAAVAAAASRGATTAVTGQGFAPMGQVTGEVLRLLLDRVQVVDVRDEASSALVARPGALSGDDLWLAGLDQLVDRERARDLDAVVCVQGDLLSVDEDWLMTACLTQLRSWGVDPARTAVLECIPRVDRVVFDRLEQFLPGLQFVPWIEVLDRGLPAGAHQRWFSTRFHPHLIAGWAGASGVAVPVRPGYYDVKHGSLFDAGSSWQLLAEDGRGPAPVAGARPDGFTRTAERVAAVKHRIATQLYGPVVAAS
ncbi:polysaccharide pyruvyl transferase family protein [Modestobacter sp. SYSU DS0657]